MSRQISYEDIIKYVEENNISKSKILFNKEEFERAKIEQGKSGLYTSIKMMCSCGNEYERTFASIKQTVKKYGVNKVVCGECSKENIANRRRLSKEEKILIIEKAGITYIDGEIRNHDSYFNVMCSCGDVFKTSLRIIKNRKSDSMKCKECRSEKARNLFKKDFNIIRNYFESEGCKLLSTESDYENAKTKLRYIAKCGHEHIGTYEMFNNSIYKMCPKCTKQFTSGENNYNWKGGTYNTESEKFRKTYEFKKWRIDVFKRDNHTCQICGSYGNKLNAHHLDGYNWCKEKRTDVDNGITLCEKCHNDFHSNYGIGNNTKSQYYEYVNKIQNGYIIR